MSKTIKYTIEHIEKTHKYMNEDKMSKKDASIKAGFSDPSLYYTTLKRLNIQEYIATRSIVNFI